MFGYFRNIAAKVFRQSRIETDMEEELHSHIQHRADDLERSGLNRSEAERRARIEFGGFSRYKEEARAALGGMFIETLMQDVRFSLRLLRKSPGFAIISALTLALAIAANAVVFGVLNAIIIRPLNVPRSESLYEIQHGNDATSQESYPDYLDLRDRNRSFDGLAAYNVTQAALDTGNNPSRTWVEEASGNYFDVLDIHPYLGRFFHASDEHGANSALYIVLTYDYWRGHFLGDRDVIGRTVLLNKHPFTILGVAPPEFHGTLLFFYPDYWVPIVNQEQVEGWNGLNERRNRWVFTLLGHLKAGVTPAQAVADLNSIGSYLEKTYPKDDDQRKFTLARPNLYGDLLGRPARAFLGALMLLAGLILLAACANLGSLFAARTTDRSREVALRLALGSSRNRILRGLLTESVLISTAGGTLGLLGSLMLLKGLSTWRPVPRWPIHVPVSPDAHVYEIALVLALVSGILFGIVPVRQILGINPYDLVKSGSRATGHRRLTIRDVMVAVQIAVCAVLVTSSMVAFRGLAHSLNTDFGFEPQNVTLVNTDLRLAGYSGDQIPELQKRMVNATKAIPGVRYVGLVDWPALCTGGWITTPVFKNDTTDLRPSNAAAQSVLFRISPGYFQAASTALLAGRTFTWHDDKNAPRVAVINQEFARRIFGSVANAIGRDYKMPDRTRIAVVGVVRDGKYESLTEAPQLAMFLPIAQSPRSATWLLVRSDLDQPQLAASIRNTLHRIDSALPLYIGTWSKEMDFALFAPHVAAVSLGILGIMAAMLSITGIFGMAAYSVSKRLKELGIRTALGAQRKEVLQAALGRAVRLLTFGSAAGLILGILASQVLASIVYEATPRDPLVLTGVVVVMALLGLIATWIPAQRALSLDPSILLREE